MLRRAGFNLQRVSRELNGLDAVNVARPGKFGNPFRIGGYFMMGDPNGISRGPRMIWCEAQDPEKYWPGKFTLIRDNDMAVEWFIHLKELHPLTAAEIAELRGKNLGCYCRLDIACHGNVLLELANG